MKNYKKEKEFWNSQNIVKYFEEKPFDPRVKRRLEKLSSYGTLKALDLGCGGGRHSELLINLGFETYGCDINKKMIFKTKQRVGKLMTKEYIDEHFKYGSIDKLPYPDNFFDVVVTTGVLHQSKNLNEYVNSIKELNRVSKSGAIICLNIFTNKAWDQTYTRLEGEKYTVITKEGLFMTLLTKEIFYKMMENENLHLEQELSEDIKVENTGKRSVLRANFIKIDENLSDKIDYPSKVLKKELITKIHKNNHEYYHLIQNDKIDNPFLKNTYDLDKDFYKGKFKAVNPISKNTVFCTPEEYGRMRIVAFLLNNGIDNKNILDFGAGSANIQRNLFLNAETKEKLNCYFVNADICGPIHSSIAKSLLEVGSDLLEVNEKNTNHTINLEYDFNSSIWPFKRNCFDYVVSCMAIHHVEYDRKEIVMKNLYKSMRRNSKLVIMDFFSKQSLGFILTDNGRRGPNECIGYGQPILEFLAICKKVGFLLDENASKLLKEKRSYQYIKEGETAINKLELSLQINKATWYLLLSKK